METITILAPLLVIGYGNTLRGDDGVGYQVAEAVAEWQLPGVRSRAVHQLLPELAEAMAEVKTVVFVDAVVGNDSVALSTPLEIKIQPVRAKKEASLRSHLFSPEILLILTKQLYGVTPKAYLLTIPAFDFSLGTTLSWGASTGKHLALEELKSLLVSAQFHS